MNNQYPNYFDNSEDQTLSLRQHLTKTYGLMALGLTLTFVASLCTALFLPMLIYNFKLSLILILAEVVTVIAFSAMIHRASYGAVVGMYIFYAILSGVSLSYIFVFYDITSIFLCFAAAAISFGIMALIGHSTKKDLSAFGSLFFAGLIGLILLTIVGLFINSSILEIVICCVGLVLFLGITAFDTQRMQNVFMAGGDNQTTKKYAVYFALELYLDFINIFVYLLRLFGRTRD